MLRWIKRSALLAVLLVAQQTVMGFSLLGPVDANSDPWEVPTIGYRLPQDIGGPKNLGEEYRWTTPNIYYAFNASFLDYFGSNGVYAVERAIAILNNLTNFTSYSKDLSEFPLESMRINPRAEALHLLDMKSVALRLMLEELGLTDADRYVWTIRTRDVQPGRACPFMIYDVIKRNFDPVTWEPSSYVNGNLLTYQIFEICTGPNPLADAVEFPVDPEAQEFSAVMSADGVGGFDVGVLRYGVYVTSLSRDDVGGLRYIYRTNNMNFEPARGDTTEFVTNRAPSLIISSNIDLLFAQSLTNGPAALQALFPNLVINSSSNFFGVLATTNLVVGITNQPWDPAGTFEIVFTTNVTFSAQTFFSYSFGNLVTVQLTNGLFRAVPFTDFTTTSNRLFVTTETTIVTNAPWSTGVLITNTIRHTTLRGGPGGEFFFLPTNACDIQILSPLLTNIVATTNFIVSSTNNPSFTNLPPGVTNITTPLVTQTEIHYFTNHAFLALTVDCLSGGTNTFALREGMDHFKFLRTSYDSLLGRFYQPITNTYYLIEVTNSVPRTNWFRRVITRPDFLFEAQDLQSLPASAIRSDTAVIFLNSNEPPGLGGPGIIDNSGTTNGISITFNKVGPNIGNIYTPSFLFNNGLTESTARTNYIWGFYDGTTNAPIIFPQGSSIMNLENQVFFQIVTPLLASGRVNVPYSESLEVTDGTGPFTWVPAPASPPLPPGLVLSSTGIVSGIPTTPGAYTFVVTVTDAASHISTRTISITINR